MRFVMPASASQRRSSAPARPENGRPVVSSTAPGAWPMIMTRSLALPATIGNAAGRWPAATHFVHARIRE